MKALVTGSTGLLGNNLVRMLVERGHEVTGLVRSEEKAQRLLGDLDVRFVQGDMQDVAGFADALDGCDTVFHTAAYFREYFQPGNHAEKLKQINIDGTLQLMNEADRREVSCFVHVSSSGAIGKKPDGSPGDEDTPPLPVQMANLYFRSKVEGDEAIRTWKPDHGLEVIEILPGWMWGPGDAAPTSAGQMALDFLGGRIPGIIDGGSSLVDARDVAAAMIAAVGAAGHGSRYIVGGNYYSLKEVMQCLERVSGVPAPKRRMPQVVVMSYAWLMELIGRLTGREVLVTREGVRTMLAKLAVSSAKAEEELGATFRPLEETLRDVVNWYREHPASPIAKAA